MRVGEGGSAPKRTDGRGRSTGRERRGTIAAERRRYGAAVVASSIDRLGAEIDRATAETKPITDRRYKYI